MPDTSRIQCIAPPWIYALASHGRCTLIPFPCSTRHLYRNLNCIRYYCRRSAGRVETVQMRRCIGRQAFNAVPLGSSVCHMVDMVY